MDTQETTRTNENVELNEKQQQETPVKEERESEDGSTEDTGHEPSNGVVSATKSHETKNISSPGAFGD